MRTLQWDHQKNELVMIDQRLLPGEFKLVNCKNHAEVASAISEMVVRGAPAIGVAAAFGIALAAINSKTGDLEALKNELRDASRTLQSSRPTAVNLAWALKRLMEKYDTFSGSADNLRGFLIAEACRMAEEDVEINRRMAEHGARLIDDGDTIIHHCNTGALAAVDWGTALGVIRMAHEQGKNVHVLVDETRPRLQGARLTAWELQQYGIPYEIITDNMAGYFLRSGQVKKVFFGADRITANGDVANKIGTYMLSLAAFDNQVPAYTTAPISTIDLSLASGEQIPIEERSPSEVLDISYQGQQVTPTGAHARNPAFDVTPHRLITGIITEKGVIYPPYIQNLASTLQK
ncbi:MAG: S-methyl-5-thioribose-1-phosphate isomerase [Chloroflexi bacterium]|nr:S-methyl-5-thioribose-1-phosphate isomerase [Chloroflexota bacterium]